MFSHPDCKNAVKASDQILPLEFIDKKLMYMEVGDSSFVARLPTLLKSSNIVIITIILFDHLMN